MGSRTDQRDLRAGLLLMAVNALFPMLLLAGSCEYTLEWGKLYHTLALTGGSGGVSAFVRFFL